MKRLFFMLAMMLCLGGAEAQTIRNANNSTLATIERDGTVRNSSNSTVGKINGN